MVNQGVKVAELPPLAVSLSLSAWRFAVSKMGVTEFVAVQRVRVALTTHFYRADHCLGDSMPRAEGQDAIDLVNRLLGSKWPQRL